MHSILADQIRSDRVGQALRITLSDAPTTFLERALHEGMCLVIGPISREQGKADTGTYDASCRPIDTSIASARWRGGRDGRTMTVAGLVLLPAALMGVSYGQWVEQSASRSCICAMAASSNSVPQVQHAVKLVLPIPAASCWRFLGNPGRSGRRRLVRGSASVKAIWRGVLRFS